MAAGGPGRRPRVALFTVGLKGDLTQRTFFSLARERFDLVVYAHSLEGDLREQVEWRRVPAARYWRPRLAWGLYFGAASVQRLGMRADLVHTWAPFPLMAGKVDLATVGFCHAAYHEATGGQVFKGHRAVWTAARRFTVGLERWRYGNGGVRMLAAMSRGSKRDLEHHYPGVPVALTPRGVDTGLFRPDQDSRREVREELGIGADETVAIHVASGDRFKGLAVLLRAAAELQRRGRRPPLILVVGRRHEWALPLAEELEIPSRVRLVGHRTDVERYYRAADMLVMPTVYETFCRVAFEAAATGLPVVGPPRVPGVEELVGDDEAGLLAERDPDSVAAAIERLTADPALRERLGREGRRRCLERPPRLFAESTLACYERLLDQR